MGKSKEDLITELHFLAEEYVRERWANLPKEAAKIVVGVPEDATYRRRKRELFDLWRYQFFFDRCVELAEKLEGGE